MHTRSRSTVTDTSRRVTCGTALCVGSNVRARAPRCPCTARTAAHSFSVALFDRRVELVSALAHAPLKLFVIFNAHFMCRTSGAPLASPLPAPPRPVYRSLSSKPRAQATTQMQTRKSKPNANHRKRSNRIHRDTPPERSKAVSNTNPRHEGNGNSRGFRCASIDVKIKLCSPRSEHRLQGVAFSSGRTVK